MSRCLQSQGQGQVWAGPVSGAEQGQGQDDDGVTRREGERERPDTIITDTRARGGERRRPGRPSS